jgi:hypothetical protein
MYELGQIYDEAEYELHKLLRLHVRTCQEQSITISAMESGIP